MGLGLPKVVWKKLIYRKLIRALLGLGTGIAYTLKSLELFYRVDLLCVLVKS